MNDLTRAQGWLTQHPHLAPAAVALASAIDELEFWAANGSVTQLAGACAVVKAAAFPEADSLHPVPSTDVMVQAVARMTPHLPSRDGRARTATTTSPGGHSPDDEARRGGVTDVALPGGGAGSTFAAPAPTFGKGWA